MRTRTAEVAFSGIEMQRLHVFWLVLNFDSFQAWLVGSTHSTGGR